MDEKQGGEKRGKEKERKTHLSQIRQSTLMAPPTTIRTRDQALAPLATLDSQTNCRLKELVQWECQFKGAEYVCSPFKRLFEHCIAPDKSATNYEVTDTYTNS
ncbi:BGN_3a_G0013760.mRNA.1.CDS.1 [Saccharomyces cerevisiae]|nr:BGN_3a_G0013760.mRNA.1.CDS.1 [Saccharomyces cerevisiae]CAI7096130.1 BGN_3a_G0013760.mRNA.1.CDS.1 [Saccharomyces cerevisiae]